MQNWKVTPAEVFAASPLVPVMVINDLEQALPMAKALLDGGISVFEITLRTPVALDAIALIAKAIAADPAAANPRLALIGLHLTKKDPKKAVAAAQDALAAGRYIATYGEGQEFWHLTAFDAQTGARLWDHKLRSIFAVDWIYGVVATDKNIYLVRMSSLEVHDAATGALKAVGYGFRKAPLKYDDVDWVIAMGRPRDRK
jgi:hypothetical protein